MDMLTPIQCPACGVSLVAQRIDLGAAIAQVIRERPKLRYKDIAEQFGVSARTIKRYAKRTGVQRRKRVS